VTRPRPLRRIVVTVCPRECGRVTLPVRRGERPRRLDASAIVRHLAALTSERRLGDVVELRQACAGGCGLPGPNVSVTIHPATAPGERPDHVAIAWKTYVRSLPTLDSLAEVIDDNVS
jgi:hypothetical protein